MTEDFSPITDASPAEKREAVTYANRAYRLGMLPPQPCRDCGQPCPKVLHKHHEDYSKALEVVWLCRRCHALEHSRIEREIKRQKRMALVLVKRGKIGRLSLAMEQRKERIKKLLATTPGVFEAGADGLSVKFSDNAK